jgi:ribose 5-phosphate isomerase A
VEVLPLLWERTAATISALGLEPSLRPAGQAPFISDNGNLILDCQLNGALEPAQLAAALDAIPGVIGHGLFLGIATEAAIAGPDRVRVLRPD